MERELQEEFYNCIKDIAFHPVVLQMKKYPQHGNTDCYQHCLTVAYYNFLLCKKLGLDARSAARGGILHDLFLYDWHTHKKYTGKRFHGLTHPGTACRNASKYFQLNKVEKEIILKHMWPITVVPPRYAETYIICMTDKYCSAAETIENFVAKHGESGILRFLKRKEPNTREIIREFFQNSKQIVVPEF